MIVGSFLLVFAFPPFSPDTTFAFGQWWLAMSKEYFEQIMSPFNMSMGIMSCYICAGIAYNLAQHSELDAFPTAMLSLMTFLLIAAPMEGGKLSASFLGGTGILTTRAGAELPAIFTEPFWSFFIVLGGSGATFALVLLYLRSQSVYLRSIGKLSLVPAMFNINEPVIFGSPVVMNPILFIPFVGIPMVNTTIAYVAVSTGMIGKVISLVP